MQTRHIGAKITDANCRQESKHKKSQKTKTQKIKKTKNIQLLKKKSSYTGDLFAALDFSGCFDF